MQHRSNILIISANQHRADCLGVAGRKIKTPHLDALAQSGTRFGSCITPSVAGQPARASILTGQLCRTHGVHDDGIDLDPNIGNQGFAGTLNEAGYGTAFFGKANFSCYHPKTPSGTPECIQSSAKYGADWVGPYMGFEHVELILQDKDGFSPVKPPHGQHYERFFHADGNGDQKITRYHSDLGSSIQTKNCWQSGLSATHHSTPWTADRAIDWLRHGRNKGKPFCSWVSFADLQHPYACPEPWSRLHDPELVDLPLNRTPAPNSLPPWYRSAQSRRSAPTDKNYDWARSGQGIPQQTDNQLREIIANTYGSIAFIDNQIGRLLNALTEQGLAQNTHVFYLSNHGDWLGEHGRTLQGPLFYDSLMRVPLIWRGPDVPQGRVIYEPVSTIDLSPSLMDIANVKPQLHQQGKSLRPLLGGLTKRDFAMSEWELMLGPKETNVSLRSVRTRTYKLIKDMNSEYGELYDLLSDPNELQNLFDDPNSLDIRIRLESYLMLRTQNLDQYEAA